MGWDDAHLGVLKNSAAVMSGLSPAWRILGNAMSSCLTT
jgi:hypothetical protein